MDYASLKSFSVWIGGFAAVIFAGAFIYVLYKTQSFHLLRLRIWQRVVGRDPITDPAVKALVEQESDLMAFRLFLHLPANSLDEVHQLKTWAQSRGLGLQQLSRIAPFFNVPNRCIKEIKYPKVDKWLSLCAFLVAALLTVVCLFAGMEQRVNLVLNVTGHWYWVDAHSAHASWYNKPLVPYGSIMFDSKQCAISNKKPQGEITVADQDVLCGIWQDKDASEQIQSLLNEQRFLTFFFLFVFVWVMGWLILRQDQLRTVEKLRSKLTLGDS